MEYDVEKMQAWDEWWLVSSGVGYLVKLYVHVEIG